MSSTEEAVVAAIEAVAPAPAAPEADDTAWLEQATVLDKSKPYGTVMPAEGGKKYFQHGNYFDHYGLLIKE